MDKVIRQRELDDVDAGLPASQVLQWTVDSEQAKLDRALAELSELAGDEEILTAYGVDMTQLRRPVDWSRVWSLP